MMVLSDECKKCHRTCNTIHFQQNFESWTSGNDDIDKFIQDTQLSVHYKSAREALELMPYDRFYDLEYIEKIGVYKANWFDGSINHWDNKNQNWQRTSQNEVVTLKSLNNTKNITLEFTKEV
jgi:hypothetical protein